MKHDYKLAKAESEAKTKCRCGHTEVMLPKTESMICSYCGNRLYNTSLSRFRYLLSEKLIQKKMEMN